MTNWNNQALMDSISAEFGDKILHSEETYGLLNIEVPASDAKEIILWLKNHEALKMSFLTDLCAVHYPEKKDRELAVVYHLHSLTHNIRLRVKSFLPISNPVIPTLTGVYAAANWMERETFDFFGVQFEGHPDLRRILNMDDMDYHPLRKEYALEDETREDKKDKYFGR